MKTTKIFNAVQKKIILAQSCAADSNPDDAISSIAEALKLNPDLDTRKLLEKAADEFSRGVVAIGEDFLDSALEAAGNFTLSAVVPICNDLEEGGTLPLTFAQVIRQRADLLAALVDCRDCLIATRDSGRSDALTDWQNRAIGAGYEAMQSAGYPNAQDTSAKGGI